MTGDARRRPAWEPDGVKGSRAGDEPILGSPADAATWWAGYEAGLRVGWLDALDFAFTRDERAEMNAAVLDEMTEALRGDPR